MNSNRVVVTGGDGFIGKRLCSKLQEKGLTILNADLANGTDITHWDSLAASGMVDTNSGIDTVFHLAARTFVPESYVNPRNFYYTNIVGTLHALELCRIHKAKMVFSSSYVYGVPQYLPVDEVHPVQAFNPYAQSKILGEELCHAYYRDFKVNSVILRPFNIYGPGQIGPFLIPSIISQLQTGRHIRLESSAPKRDYVHADDVVAAYLAALQWDSEGCETFNIASGKSYSVDTLVQMCIELSGYNCNVEYTGSARPNDIADTVANISKAKEKLNWVPAISFPEGLRGCIERGA